MLNSELTSLLKPVISDLGYELWGCERITYGNQSLLRIYIDSDNGIGIEDCERVSKQVSGWLDVEDPIPGNYTLEVSSPGLPKPLFYPYQYTRFIGLPIQLKLHQLVDGKRKLSGIIVSCDSHYLHVDVSGIQHTIDFTNIVKAYLTVE